MSRTLIVGDIHGGLRALRQLLEHPLLTGDERFIFLGDYVDGWSESAQVLQYLIKFSRKHPCTFIIGNHDRWAQDWLRGEPANSLWLTQGGQSTLDSYLQFSDSQRMEHAKFLASMPYYHIDADMRLFIHAGFTSMHGVKKEVYHSNYFWDRTLWEAALLLKNQDLKPEDPYFPKRFKHYNEIYIGHTCTTHFGSSEPIQAGNLWNVDTGASYTGRLTMLDVESKEFWQSDPLPALYPDEEGRN